MEEVRLKASSLKRLQDFNKEKTFKIIIFDKEFTVPSLFPAFVSEFVDETCQKKGFFEIKESKIDPKSMQTAFNFTLGVFRGKECPKLRPKIKRAALELSRSFKSPHLERYFESSDTKRALFPIPSFSKGPKFSFRIGETSRDLSVLEAALISDRAKHLILDENIFYLEIRTDGFEEADVLATFDEIAKLLEGSSLNILINQVKLFKHVGEQIGNESILSFCKPILGICKEKKESVDVDYFAQNFSKIKQRLFEMDPITIESILLNPKLSVSSQSKITDFLIQYTKLHGPGALYLFDKMNITNIPPKDMQMLAESVPLPPDFQQRVSAPLKPPPKKTQTKPATTKQKPKTQTKEQKALNPSHRIPSYQADFDQEMYFVDDGLEFEPDFDEMIDEEEDQKLEPDFEEMIDEEEDQRLEPDFDEMINEEEDQRLEPDEEMHSREMDDEGLGLEPDEEPDFDDLGFEPDFDDVYEDDFY